MYDLNSIYNTCKYGSILNESSGGASLSDLKTYIKTISKINVDEINIDSINKKYDLIKLILNNINLNDIKEKNKQEFIEVTLDLPKLKKEVEIANKLEADLLETNKSIKSVKSVKPIKSIKAITSIVEPIKLDKKIMLTPSSQIALQSYLGKLHKNENEIKIRNFNHNNPNAILYNNFILKTKDVGGGGDCFFYVIIDAFKKLNFIDDNGHNFSENDNKRNILYLRNIVRQSFINILSDDDVINNDGFITYVKFIYDEYKNAHEDMDDLIDKDDDITNEDYYNYIYENAIEKYNLDEWLLTSKHWADDFDVSTIITHYKIKLFQFRKSTNNKIDIYTTSCIKHDDNYQYVVPIYYLNNYHYLSCSVYDNENKLFFTSVNLNNVPDNIDQITEFLLAYNC